MDYFKLLIGMVSIEFDTVYVIDALNTDFVSDCKSIFDNGLSKNSDTYLSQPTLVYFDQKQNCFILSKEASQADTSAGPI